MQRGNTETAASEESTGDYGEVHELPLLTIFFSFQPHSSSNSDIHRKKVFSSVILFSPGGMESLLSVRGIQMSNE